MEEKKVLKVVMEESDTREMEKAWYEYNASRDIISFLMTEKQVIWETLQEYINVAEKRFTQCEMMKNRLANKYKTPEIDLTKYNYGFDFEENTITFEEA